VHVRLSIAAACAGLSLAVTGCGTSAAPSTPVLTGDAADPSKLSDQIKKLDADPKFKDAIAKAPECAEMRAKLGKMLAK
jgi:hypothetical protein